MSNRRYGLAALIGVALVGLIAGMVFTARLDLFNQAVGQDTEKADVTRVARTISPEDLSGQPLTYDVFRKIAKRLNPTVVNIYTTQVVRGRDPFHDFFGDDPFFRRFFGDTPQEERESRQNSLGSGVVIDAEGYILTNNHVIENAESIKVSFEDDDATGRNGLDAKVIGRDPKTDIALIKIEPKTDLVAAPLGDSGVLEVGDWVIAIGNPFNLGHTVTVGVVSAKGRALGNVTFEDFIQTDASINPGNSGGPLLNLRGEVIGINTAIASRTGQSAGIGFAVPINMAKEILPQLKSSGRVIRGQLGVSIQSQWNDAMKREFGIDYGALISDVTKGSAADKAGLKRGDVIIEYNGKSLKEGNELPKLVAATKPGSTVKLKVLRDRKERELTVTVGTMKDTDLAAGDENGTEEERSTAELGLTVKDLDSDTARQLDLESDEGVIVTRVKVNSPAETAEIQRGDVILEINRSPVKSVDDYRDIVTRAKPGESLLFLIYRRGNTFFVPVEVPNS
jgi:serine protease Do